MLIAADVSYYQQRVDSSYPHPWLIIRGCDGGFLDPNASFNADWCRGAVVQGRMQGWTVYVVYRPGMNGAVLQNLIRIGGPWDRLEVDIESWGGQIVGDHSGDINNLILDLGALVGFEKVWRYGNRGDLAGIHPHPLPGQLTRIASYTGSRPTDVPNLVGWQYTDGTQNHTGNPSSSSPFGTCDHNELYVDELSPSGGGTQIGGLSVADAASLEAQINALRTELLTRIDGVGDVTTDYGSKTGLKPEMDRLLASVEPTYATVQAINAKPGGAVDVNALAAALAPLLKVGASKQDVVDAITSTIKVG